LLQAIPDVLAGGGTKGDVKGTVGELCLKGLRIELKGHCLEIQVICTGLTDEESKTQQF
jgi:hypothetical protein